MHIVNHLWSAGGTPLHVCPVQRGPIASRLAKVPFPEGVLAAIAFALTDYQLGSGGAAMYWRTIDGLLAAHPSGLTPAGVVALIETLVREPVSGRLGEQKVERVKRLVDSHFPQILRAGSLESFGGNPSQLWDSLAAAMAQGRNAKTIVFAMKIFDLLHRIAVGRYAAFGDVPIVADLRIARLSFSSGLVVSPGAQSVPSTLVAAGELLQRHPALFIDAWSRVSTAGRKLNLFRVDSL